jgi:hypothetical protein
MCPAAGAEEAGHPVSQEIRLPGKLVYIASNAPRLHARRSGLEVLTCGRCLP